MASSSSLLSFFSSSLSLTFLLCFIGTAKAALTKTEMINQFMEGHNSARQAVGVPQLTWDPKLATFARVYSNERRHDCRLVHSTALAYGENIFWGQGSRWSAKDAMAAWVDEKKWYSYSNNACSGDCSHYTQIVWRTTERVGCAKIVCDSGDSFITCEYYPPGNYVGARPY